MMIQQQTQQQQPPQASKKRPRVSKSSSRNPSTALLWLFLLVLSSSSRSTSEAFVIPSLSVSRSFWQHSPVYDESQHESQEPQHQQQKHNSFPPSCRNYNNHHHHHHHHHRNNDNNNNIPQAAQAWARKYTSVDELRKMFDGPQPRNRLWGDLDAASARQLYQCLLPKALLQLHHYYSTQLPSSQRTNYQDSPADWAPVAYQARLAAKLYARERSYWPYRWAAHFYDGYRQWRKYGKFQMHGMSYQQLWDKYARALGHSARQMDGSEADVAAAIGQTILERACASNAAVDQWCLAGTTKTRSSGTTDSTRTATAATGSTTTNKRGLTTQELQRITQQIEDDVQNLIGAEAVLMMEEDPIPTKVVVTIDSTHNSIKKEKNNNQRHRLAQTTCPRTKRARYRRLRQLAHMKSGMARLNFAAASTP